MRYYLWCLVVGEAVGGVGGEVDLELVFPFICVLALVGYYAIFVVQIAGVGGILIFLEILRGGLLGDVVGYSGVVLGLEAALCVLC